ncbi:MAG: hypothetical protein KBC91_02750 [Candidatus Omnitrophica bacterium]|nr:hypothetical protein [Candidatus Omnitrophota bacterium]
MTQLDRFFRNAIYGEQSPAILESEDVPLNAPVSPDSAEPVLRASALLETKPVSGRGMDEILLSLIDSPNFVLGSTPTFPADDFKALVIRSLNASLFEAGVINLSRRTSVQYRMASPEEQKAKPEAVKSRGRFAFSLFLAEEPARPSFYLEQSFPRSDYEISFFKPMTMAVPLTFLIDSESRVDFVERMESGTQTFYVLVPDKTVKAIRNQNLGDMLDFTAPGNVNTPPQRLVIVGETEANEDPQKYDMFKRGEGEKGKGKNSDPSAVAALTQPDLFKVSGGVVDITPLIKLSSGISADEADMLEPELAAAMAQVLTKDGRLDVSLDPVPDTKAGNEGRALAMSINTSGGAMTLLRSIDIYATMGNEEPLRLLLFDWNEEQGDIADRVGSAPAVKKLLLPREDILSVQFSYDAGTAERVKNLREMTIVVSDWTPDELKTFGRSVATLGGGVEFTDGATRFVADFPAFRLTIKLQKQVGAPTSVSQLSQRIPAIQRYAVLDADLKQQLLDSGFKEGPLAGAGDNFSQFQFIPDGQTGFDNDRYVSFIAEFTGARSGASRKMKGFIFKAVASEVSGRWDATADENVKDYLRQVRRVGNKIYLLLEIPQDRQTMMAAWREIQGVASGKVAFTELSSEVQWEMVTTEEAQTPEGYERFKDIFIYDQTLPGSPAVADPLESGSQALGSSSLVIASDAKQSLIIPVKPDSKNIAKRLAELTSDWKEFVSGEISAIYRVQDGAGALREDYQIQEVLNSAQRIDKLLVDFEKIHLSLDSTIGVYNFGTLGNGSGLTAFVPLGGVTGIHLAAADEAEPGSIPAQKITVYLKPELFEGYFRNTRQIRNALKADLEAEGLVVDISAGDVPEIRFMTAQGDKGDSITLIFSDLPEEQTLPGTVSPKQPPSSVTGVTGALADRPNLESYKLADSRPFIEWLNARSDQWDWKTTGDDFKDKPLMNQVETWISREDQKTLFATYEHALFDGDGKKIRRAGMQINFQVTADGTKYGLYLTMQEGAAAGERPKVDLHVYQLGRSTDGGYTRVRVGTFNIADYQLAGAQSGYLLVAGSVEDDEIMSPAESKVLTKLLAKPIELSDGQERDTGLIVSFASDLQKAQAAVNAIAPQSPVAADKPGNNPKDTETGAGRDVQTSKGSNVENINVNDPRSTANDPLATSDQRRATSDDRQSALTSDQPAFELLRLRIAWKNSSVQNAFGPVIDELLDPALTEERWNELVSLKKVEELFIQARRNQPYPNEYDADQINGLVLTIRQASQAQGLAISPALSEFLGQYVTSSERGRLIQTGVDRIVEELRRASARQIDSDAILNQLVVWLRAKSRQLGLTDLTTGTLGDWLSEYDAQPGGANFAEPEVRLLVMALNREGQAFRLQGSPLSDDKLRRVVAAVWAAVIAARSEVRNNSVQRSASSVQQKMRSTIHDPLASQRVLSELSYAEAAGFVHTREVKADDPYAAEFIQAVGGAWLTPSRVPGTISVRIVSDPVKLPGDNMLLHVETESILYDLDARSSKLEESVTLSEMGFQVNGQPVPLLVHETDRGKEVWVRESLWRSFENALRAKRLPSSNFQLLTSNLKQTTRPQTEAYSKLEKSTGSRSLTILVTPEIIRKNYGFAQSATLLGSLGHRIAVLEDPNMNAAQRKQFYRDYALEGMLNKTVFAISADTPSLKMRLSEINGGEVPLQDVVALTFTQQDMPQLPQAMTKLVVEPQSLLLSHGARPDYPIAFLAAQLLLQPDEIEKLGEKIISRTGTSVWNLHQTPAGGEISEALQSEIANYQALSQSA